MSALPRGPKFVAGYSNSDGHIVLTREDGTTSPPLPFIVVRGTLTENDDYTCNITFAEE